MPDALNLTIAIPVRNEEINLAGCLQAIGNDFAREIVIIDSGSTDRTIEIANEFGVEVIDFAWNGKFPKKRNWFLRNHTPETLWILFLDADEFITPEFKSAVRSALQKNNSEGYWLNYTIYFLGKALKWGYPLRKLALFKVGSGEYEKIEEDLWSRLDMEIHEHPVISGNVGVIKQRIDHRDFQPISHYIAKHNEYASWEAERFLKTAATASAQHNWTRKQKLKYRLIRSPIMGLLYFCGSFVFMGGFLDGQRGFAFAVLKMSYFTQIYCKIKEREIRGI